MIDELISQLNIRFVYFKEPNSLLFDPIFVTATLLDPKFALCWSENKIGESIKFLDLLKKNKLKIWTTKIIMKKLKCQMKLKCKKKTLFLITF